MPRAARRKSDKLRNKRNRVRPNTRFLDALALAEQSGLLKGTRTKVLRGRMPAALVDRAKETTGARTDTELIEFALAHVATVDEYANWLISRRGSIPKGLDLEF